VARTLEEVRRDAMELGDEDRQLLAEDLIHSRWDPAWREAWADEVERRKQRLASGEDRELTLDEFFADD
jgi:hypothetical protein